MTQVHLFCEGQTEESFIWHVLYEDLFGIGVYLNPILVSASLKGKCGLARYNGIKRQILRKNQDDQRAYGSKLFDKNKIFGIIIIIADACICYLMA